MDTLKFPRDRRRHLAPFGQRDRRVHRFLLAAALIGHMQAAQPQIFTTNESAMQVHPYVGMWVTRDGYIRHELLPNGRYDEARGNKRSAYQGRYEVSGTHIEYWDDTGFTADGDFKDDVLYHAGMVLYREHPRK